MMVDLLVCLPPLPSEWGLAFVKHWSKWDLLYIYVVIWVFLFLYPFLFKMAPW